MQHIYTEVYVGKNRGVSDAEFKAELESFTGRNLDEFYAKYIDGTEIPDYNEFLEPIGVAVNYVGVLKPSAGVSTSASGGNVMVRSIRSGSAAEDAGLSVNDEIIAVNNYRMDKSMLDAFMGSLSIGEEVEILFSRNEELHTTTLEMKGYERPKFNYEIATENAKTKALFDFWLGEK
jgi:predicted metalloprotease with PDZ domain